MHDSMLFGEIVYASKIQADEDDTVVKIDLSILNVALIIASVFYIWCLVLAIRKLSSLQSVNPDLGMKKLLVVSIILLCLVRIMTFIGVTAMDIANVRAHYSPNPSSSYGNEEIFLKITSADNVGTQSEIDTSESVARSSQSDNQNFYDSSMTILFDLPNAIVVSTFVLLTLVWAECFLQSRFHTESMIKWKKRWLMGYTAFNSCLFSGQLTLYILIFWPGTDDSVRIVKGIIYAGMIATNLGACIVAAFSYFYLNIRFAVSFKKCLASSVTDSAVVLANNHGIDRKTNNSVLFSFTKGLPV